MNAKARRVRSLVLRSYVGSAFAFFALFFVLTAFFGWELEDQIFDYQVSGNAEELAARIDTLPSYGRSAGVPMEYYVGRDAMPAWMQAEISPAWGAGNYEIFGEERGHLHLAIREVEGTRLYVIFNARAYIRSTPQIIAYLKVIGGMAGLGLVISLIFLVRMTRRVTDPLEDIAEALAAREPGQTGKLGDGSVAELRQLVNAIEARDERILALLARERQFNRDASHELRTPLAVAVGAAEVLESQGEASGRALTRLKTALADMQHLTEGILWLGREVSEGSMCEVQPLFESAVSAYRHLLQDRAVEVQIKVADDALSVPVPESVGLVLIGNLVRNAFSYTDTGSVTLQAYAGCVSVTDTGPGFGNVDAEKGGFGIGLSLVERLCEHFGLQFDVQASTNPTGTTATIRW